MADAAFPVPGQLLHMVRAGTTVTLGDRLKEGGQGVVHRASLSSGAMFAVKWYRPASASDAQREAIETLVGHGRPHPAFIWPLDVVTCPTVAGFGYVMPLLEPRFISFAEMLESPNQPTFDVMAVIGRELVDAFAALHASGLCYRDISFGNLFVDPVRAEVAVIDNDNVGIDGGDARVLGTLRFMAPEIVRREALPATVSDLHSLAVLLFYLYFHGHPLDGQRVEGTYTWEGERHRSDSELATIHYGLDPLFVFNPSDRSNRPVPGDPMLRWWPLYPRFFRELFVRAFTVGLVDASLTGRNTESVWRKALLRLRDCVSQCENCPAGRFFDPDEPGAPCWNCGYVPQRPGVLEIGGSSIVVSPGNVVTAHHLLRNRDHRTVEARIEAHPRHPGELVIRNEGSVRWTVRPEGEEEKTVKPGQRLAVRPAAIDFGPATGIVRV